MVKLIYLITDLELGGAPLVLRDRARAIRDLGDFVPTVVSLAEPGPVGKMMRADGIEVIGLGARGVWDLPRVLWRWGRVLRCIRPSIVQSMLVHANMIAGLGRPLGPPAVYLQELHTTQPRPRWHWWVQGRIARHCAALLAPSQEVLDMLAQHGRIGRGIVIPNGVAVARFRDALPISAVDLPWPAGSRVIGYVGRFDPIKRLDLLINSMAQLGQRPELGDVQLALVGYGVGENRLKSLAQTVGFGSRIHFPGPTVTPERWYKTFTIMCLPSEAEGMPMTLLESLAAQTPVVASDIPAITSLVTHGREAWLVSNPTPNSLSTVLTEALENPDECQKRAAAGFARVTSAWSVEAVAAEHNKILRNFLRK